MLAAKPPESANRVTPNAANRDAIASIWLAAPRISSHAAASSR
jgi:hypothetical protein